MGPPQGERVVNRVRSRKWWEFCFFFFQIKDRSRSLLLPNWCWLYCSCILSISPCSLIQQIDAMDYTDESAADKWEPVVVVNTKSLKETKKQTEAIEIIVCEARTMRALVLEASGSCCGWVLLRAWNRLGSCATGEWVVIVGRRGVPFAYMNTDSHVQCQLTAWHLSTSQDFTISMATFLDMRIHHGKVIPIRL